MFYWCFLYTHEVSFISYFLSISHQLFFFIIKKKLKFQFRRLLFGLSGLKCGKRRREISQLVKYTNVHDLFFRFQCRKPNNMLFWFNGSISLWINYELWSWKRILHGLKFINSYTRILGISLVDQSVVPGTLYSSVYWYIFKNVALHFNILTSLIPVLFHSVSQLTATTRKKERRNFTCWFFRWFLRRISLKKSKQCKANENREEWERKTEKKDTQCWLLNMSVTVATELYKTMKGHFTRWKAQCYRLINLVSDS